MKKYVLAILVVLLFTIYGCGPSSVTVSERPVATVGIRSGSPGAGYVWIDGDWYWSGGRYVYRDGYWARPRGHRVWVAGDWRQRGNGWYWRKGRWHH